MTGLNLSARVTRLEAEASPPEKVKVTCTWANSPEEVDALRKSPNVIAQGEMYILSWLPPQD